MPHPTRTVLMALCTLLTAAVADAQQRPHYLNAGALPPGAIGAAQLMRAEPLQGHFQPVEVRASKGVTVSLAIHNQFGEALPTPMKAGMLVGNVYRLRVTNLPDRPGVELFPTIEVLNRLCPPPGQEARFPIPVELSEDEIEMAIRGKLITRVIYLESPDAALPIDDDPRRQMNFEVGPKENPLEVADRLGRPMAILRLGGRVPSAAGPDATFMYNSPPALRYFGPEEVAVQMAKREAAQGNSLVLKASATGNAKSKPAAGAQR